MSAIKDENRRQRITANPGALTVEAVLDICQRLRGIVSQSPLADAVTAWAEERVHRRVMENVGLVHNQVTRVYGRAMLYNNIPLDDAAQEGMITMQHAAYLFDESRGFQFSTYAVRWIKQTLRRLLCNDATIRLPVYLQEGGKAAANNGSAKQRPRPCLSLDAGKNGKASSEDDSGYRLMETIPANKDTSEVDRADARIDLADLMRFLDPQDRAIIALRHLRGMTLEQVAKAVGKMRKTPPLTRERIRQIEARALEKMRKVAKRLNTTEGMTA